MTQSLTHLEFCKLSWQILEAKIKYYLTPEFVTINDTDYDSMEIQYLTYCRDTGTINTLVHKMYPGMEDMDYSHAMMEIDESRPSVQLAMSKIFAVHEGKVVKDGKLI